MMHARFVLSGVAERCANTRRPLTQSLDLTKEGAEMDHTQQQQPPNTPFTAQMRFLWECLPDAERPAFHDWCAGFHRNAPLKPTSNGIALAAVAFDRALDYWPDFFRPTDVLPVRMWAEVLDWHAPTATPEIVATAVDSIAADHEEMWLGNLIARVRAVTEG